MHRFTGNSQCHNEISSTRATCINLVIPVGSNNSMESELRLYHLYQDLQIISVLMLYNIIWIWSCFTLHGILSHPGTFSVTYRYVPCVVDHSDNQPCAGLFMLHQGIQRRIAITIMQEQSPEIDLIWKDVKELVVGGYSRTPLYQPGNLSLYCINRIF